MYFSWRLWEYTRGVRLRIVWAVVVGLLAAVVGIARLALLGWLLGRVFAGAGVAELLPAFAAVAGVMVLRGVLDHARTMIAHHTAAAVQLHLRTRLYDQVVALGPAHFGLHRTGDAVTTMVEGVEQLETYFGQYLPQLFVAALTPLLILGALAWLDLPLALTMCGFALFTLLAPALFHRWDARAALQRNRDYARFSAEFLDAVQGLATLKAFGQGAPRARLLAGRARAVFRSTMWVLATNAVARGITDTGIALGAAATLALGAWRVQSGATPLEVLLVVLMLGIEVYRPLRELRSLLHHGMMGLSSAQGVFALQQARPAVEDTAASSTLGAVGAATHSATSHTAASQTVEFDDVGFSYPGTEQAAHQGLAFAVAAGERVGVVGPSGAGKSSIVRLLLRLYDPQQGSVRIGGRDLRTMPLAELRSMLAVVNQDTYLFHGTVEDNLRFGKPHATAAELEAAARAANAHGFIGQLPQGYATVVGERGIRLSGGQRQRIAIARALLRDAPILVLDEALSSVDAENEAVIQEALERLMAGRTTLIFAHRLSSVISAQRLLVLEQGRVAESGTHAELMAAQGAYHRLMAAQAEEAEAGNEGGTGGAAAALAGSGSSPSAGFLADGSAHLEPAIAAEFGAELDPGHDFPDSRHTVAYLEPTDAILRAEGMGWPRVIAELLRMVAPWKGRLTLTFVLGVTRVAALIGVGVLSALTVAAVKRGDDPTVWLWALAVAAPAAGVLHWLESWIAHDMAFRLMAELRIALFAQLDRLAPSYLLRRRSGDLAALATHDIEMVEYFFAHTIAPAFVAMLVPAAVLATLFWYGWPLALALLPFLVLVACSPFALRRRVDELGSKAREALGELNAHSVDTIQGLAEVVAFQQETPRREGFQAVIRRHQSLRLPFYRDLTLQTAVLEGATGLGGLAVIVAGAWLTQAGRIDSALLPLFTLLAMAAFLPISEIAHVGRQLADTLGSTRRLWAVRQEPVLITDGAGVYGEASREADAEGGEASGEASGEAGVEGGAENRVGLGPRVGSSSDAQGDAVNPSSGVALALEDVRYSYHGATRPALAGVSFEAPPGQTVALVGPSGAGKTTAAHMLLRFWDPDCGAVRLDGRDLRDYRLEELRGRIALVGQDTFLFNETLADNIRMARPDATDAEVWHAIERAALHEFVSSLPAGAATPVGERGARLSGGQRQRVAIARAILKDAPVLILDEATSHLDAVNEALVRKALAELMHDRTTVVIAHRLSTVRNAHRIVVLDQGRVAESGSHAALLTSGGLYAHLVSRQLGGGAAAGGSDAPAGTVSAAD